MQTSSPSLPEAALDALRAIVGPAHVFTDRDRVAPHERDWTGRFQGCAAAVVCPADAGEVAAVLQFCHEAGIAVVPQGGNTSLVGGATPFAGEIVLSLARLDRLGDVDPLAGHVRAGAGVTLLALQEHVRAAGLDFGVDMASRGSATVGGMASTNAGGVHVLRHGPMRAQVLGLRAVLADGSVVDRTTGLRKESAGYDLAQLLVGSEGTLGVITDLLLRVVPRPASTAVALLGVESTAAAIELVAATRRALPSLQAAEVFYSDGLALVRAHAGLAEPLATAAPVYLLLEAAGGPGTPEELALALAEADGILDSALGVDRPARDRLWAYRERHTEAVNAGGIPHKLDVAVPLAQAATFEAELRRLLAEVTPGARLVLFGHLAEGNFHVNILGLEPGDELVDETVLRLVAAHGGTISSEHGIGVAKARWLHLSRTPAEIAAMRAIKRALDPRGILNPGVLLPTADAE